jgi:hypothetical protein
VLVWSVSWNDDCRPGCSPSEVDRFRLRANIGYALWAAGGAASALGIYLWQFGRPHHPARAWIEPTLAGVQLGGSF